MTDQEATERLAAGILDKLDAGAKRQVFACKRELEKTLRKYGPLGTIAFGVLSAELMAGRKPGEIVIEQPVEVETVELKCAGCGEPATKTDRDNTPLCDTCLNTPDI